MQLISLTFALLAITTSSVVVSGFLVSSTFKAGQHSCIQRGSRQHPMKTLYMGRRSEKIARTKDKTDLKRAKAFARIGKRIIMAVKAAGPDEDTNKALFDVIKEAKLVNVPKENITRAIKRASEGAQGDYREGQYEAYGHGGVGLIITSLTDNVNRANADIKLVINKADMKMASSGSVAFQFSRKGKIELNKAVDEEAVIEAAINAGVDEVEVVEGEEEGSTWVLTEPGSLTTLADGMAAAGMVGEPSMAHIPAAYIECSDEDMEKNLAAIEALEALDDVDQVEHNMA